MIFSMKVPTVAMMFSTADRSTMVTDVGEQKLAFEWADE